MAKDDFIPRLEALRGCAAIAVVGFHAYAMRNETFVTGMAPVVMFFVLSGFVLARSLERDPNPRRYLRNRIFRLLPASAASVLLFTVLYKNFGFYVGFEPSFDWVNVLLNALMIRSDINGVMWSLTIECLATPLILASFLTYKSYGPRPLVALCAILFAISSWGPYVHLLGGYTNLAPLYAFVVGVLLHFAPRPKQALQFLVVGSFVSLVMFLACGLRKQTALTILGEVISSAAIIYLVAISDGTKFFAVLDTAPTRLVGRISYSFYLLHMIGLSLAGTLFNNSLLLFFAALVLTIPMASVSWLLVERPFIALGKKRSSYLTSDYAH